MKRWRFLFLTILVIALAAVTRQPAAAAPLADTTYIVQYGDSLTRIAARYGLTVGQLAAANGLGWNSWLYAGQRLNIPGSAAPAPAPAPSGGGYVVQRGDTLMSIAARYGLTVGQLASANGLYWNSWVYVGQRLTIPGGSSPAPAPAPSTPSAGGTHVVQRGNTLFSIARTYGTTVAALRSANGLASDLIYVGQRLVIPGSGSTPTQPPAPQPTPVPNPGGSGERWIDVNLSQQRITAYEGSTPVYSAIVSTGLPGTPTVVGTFSIYVKYRYTPMSGPGYYLPNVPHTMYFYRGYAIHGAYWHNNFGQPMSHGCVNLSLADAEWFYNFASVGTKVVSHY
ncbi:MAG: LysM peptidoglycan-binding domain-containing protein [Anaerolineae bacterium]|jgi:LysM repeat protein|nr:LysM peptidoglycan-binding domain-containing protein [Anaerolineae bacterium]